MQKIILLCILSIFVSSQEPELIIQENNQTTQDMEPIIDLPNIQEQEIQQNPLQDLKLDESEENIPPDSNAINPEENLNPERELNEGINPENQNPEGDFNLEYQNNPDNPNNQEYPDDSTNQNIQENQNEEYLGDERIKAEEEVQNEITEEIKDPQTQEAEVLEEIQTREAENQAREVEIAKETQEREAKAEEARQQEAQERAIKQENQTTKPPVVSTPNTPPIEQPNPSANPSAPDFFDLNKNRSREAIRSIGPKELREKIAQCEENEDKNACFDVGMIYYQGRSIYGQQLKHALYFFDRSCDEKNGFGCYEAGIIGANLGQYQYAFIFLEKSCQSGDLRGCKNLGILYYNGWGVPKNAHRATELFNFGCKSGDQSSCQKLYLALGDAYKESRNFIGAKKYYEKGCELGDDRSCKEMEVMDLLQKELYRQNVIQNNARNNSRRRP